MGRQCEALFPGGSEPVDIHRTDLFGKLERARVIPDGFNDHVFDDLHFGDLWTKSPTPLHSFPSFPPHLPSFAALFPNQANKAALNLVEQPNSKTFPTHLFPIRDQ